MQHLSFFTQLILTANMVSSLRIT